MDRYTFHTTLTIIRPEVRLSSFHPRWFIFLLFRYKDDIWVQCFELFQWWIGYCFCQLNDLKITFNHLLLMNRFPALVTVPLCNISDKDQWAVEVKMMQKWPLRVGFERGSVVVWKTILLSLGEIVNVYFWTGWTQTRRHSQQKNCDVFILDSNEYGNHQFVVIVVRIYCFTSIWQKWVHLIKNSFDWSIIIVNKWSSQFTRGIRAHIGGHGLITPIPWVLYKSDSKDIL